MPPPPLDLLVLAHRAVTPTGESSAAVGVRDGRIACVQPWWPDDPAEQAKTAEVVELAGDEVLMPGLVDAHVHVNDPGRTEWEGFASATRAAAAGGITTIVDMPLNSIPPTVDVDSLDVKRETASGQCFVDVAFWGGAVPGNIGRLRPLHDAGVSGFKCFLLPSGVDEFLPLDAEGLATAMTEIAGFDGLLIVHAEDASTIGAAPQPHGRRYADFLTSRPAKAEDAAIARVIELARRTGCRAHILHLSSAAALPMIAAAQRDGVRLSVETCPHYLSFTAEQIPDGATSFKCCPPIRDAGNRDQLWRGLAEGTIGSVVSDHSPSTADLKCLDSGDFRAAWGGISSLQLGLSAVWTEARRRGHSLADVVRWMAAAPAWQAGMTRKGRLAVGMDADLCVFAPDDSFVVDAASLHHKNAATPYDSRVLDGVVRRAWLRGERIDTDSEGDPRGLLLTRGEA